MDIKKLKNGAILFGMALFLSSLSCKLKNSETVKKIFFCSNLPVVMDSGDILNVKDSLGIYFYKQYILFQIPVTSQHGTVTDTTYENSYEATINTKIISEKIKYGYFLYDSTKSYGYYSEILEPGDSDEVMKNFTGFAWYKGSVDSLLAAKTFSTAPFEKILDSVTLINTIATKDNDEVKKIYIPKKSNLSNHDTVTMVFSKEKELIPFHISRKLDELNHMQLRSITSVTGPVYDSVKGIRLEQKVVCIKMGRLKIADEKEVADFIEKFKKMHPDL